jgi:peptidyl-tRNA hydrolase, PTH2 family
MTDSAPPSTAAVAISVGLIAITVGYFLGQGSNIGLFGSSGNPSQPYGKKKQGWPNSYDVTIHPDSSDEELMAQQRAGASEQADVSESDEERDGDGKELKIFANTGEEVKLVLAVRTDLGMGKGTSGPATTTTPRAYITETDFYVFGYR